MKQNISLKGLLLAVIALFGVVSMSAQNRLSIEPANFISHDVVKLQVNFDKVNPVAGMDFQVALPDFLEFVGKSVERNESRFTSNTTISFNPKNGKVLIASFAETELQGESGALLYIPVKVKDGYNTEMSGDITVGNITFTTWNGKESWSQDAFQVAASYNPYKIEFAPVAETVAINAGTSSDLGIAISAECDVIGFQAVVSVPEGYTLGERAVLSDRCPGDANMTLRKDGNTYRLIYYTLSNSPMSGNEGLAFTLKVTAPEGAPENATIEFKDIVVSYAAGKSANANNFTVNVINGTPANNRLTEKLNGLENELNAAVAEIAEKYPAVKDQFTGSAVSEAIETLRGEIATAFADGSLIGKEAGFNDRCDAISAEIAKLITDAAAADSDLQESNRVAANNAAYDATKAEIAALQAALEAAKSQAAANYPGTNNETAVNAAQEAINKASEGAKAALEAVESEGTYSYTVDSEGINALIAAIDDSAKAQYEEAQRVAANQAAYKANTDELAALQATLNETKLNVAQKYPGTDVEAQTDAAQQAIDKAGEEAKAALEAVASEGTYNYTVDKEGINVLIAAITEAAKAQYEDAQRVAANQAAYKATMGEIVALQNALNAAKLSVAQKYPGTDVEAEVEAAQQAINAAAEAAKTALDAVENAGTYNYSVDKAGINKLIDAIVPAAKAKYEEAQRVAANEAAYKATSEEIAALQGALDAAKAEAAEKYGDIDVTSEVAAAQNSINAAKAAADAIYKAVATAGVFSYDVPVADIEALINAVTAKAVAGSEANRKAHNKAAYDKAIATIDALQKELDAAVEAAEKDCPHANITSVLNKAQTAITNARNDANVAYIAVDKAGVYSYTVDEAGIRALIEALSKSAAEQEAAYNEAQRVAANKAAYEAAVAEIDALQTALDAAKETVAAQYPDANVSAEVAAAQSAIDAAKADAAKALEAVANEGTFNYAVDKDGINNLIDAIAASAADQKEAARVAANKAAYEATLADIARLQEALVAAKAEAESTYPESNVDALVAEVQAAIDDITSAANQSFDAVAAAGEYDYTFDSKPVEEMIAGIVPEAKKQADEAKRVAANEAAYQASLDKIAALRESLSTVKDKIAAEYPELDVTVLVNAADDAIIKAEADAAAEYQSVAEEGVYSYEVPVAEIEALIQEILTYAEENAVDSVYADDIDENTLIYTLSGVRVTRPQQGKVNILVSKDGSARKVFVK